MNKLKFLPLLCLSFLFLTFTSCGDDEENNNESPIEGIWMLEDKSEDYGIFLVLNADDTGLIVEGSYDEISQVRYFRYVYNAEEKLLTINEIGEWPYIIDVYRVTKNQLITIEEDGDLTTFSRYDGNIKDLERLFNINLN